MSPQRIALYAEARVLLPAGVRLQSFTQTDKSAPWMVRPGLLATLPSGHRVVALCPPFSTGVDPSPTGDAKLIRLVARQLAAHVEEIGEGDELAVTTPRPPSHYGIEFE
jgi:hypothetical protein